MNEKREGDSFDLSSDDVSLQSLLGFAVKAEIESAETYRNLLNRDLPAETRTKVTRLVKQEEEHEEKFWSIFKDFFPDEEIDLPERADIENNVDIPDDITTRKLFEKAMEAERESEKFYSELADEFDDKEVRNLLGFLAANEREHYEILKEELRKLE